MRSFVIVLLLLVLALTGWWANKNIYYPYNAPTNIVTEKTTPLDFFGFLFGMRRIIADVMWVQTLQYYGGGGYEDVVSVQEYRKHENDVRKEGEYGRYRYLLAMCQRCVRIDPYFKYVYAYGGASLAWNLTRYDEALELLKEGIEHNPQFYPLQLYAAAIVYQKAGNAVDMIKKLEEAVKYPDCPFEIKNILGNIYIKYGRYEDAAKIQVDIYSTEKNIDRRESAKRKLVQLVTEKKIPPTFLDEMLSKPR